MWWISLFPLHHQSLPRTDFNSRRTIFQMSRSNFRTQLDSKDYFGTGKGGIASRGSAGKVTLSGKRKVISEDSLISTVEKLNDVRETEQITRERGAKVSKKRDSKAV